MVHRPGNDETGFILSLLPCPFCGGEPRDVESSPPGQMLYSVECGLNADDGLFSVEPATKWLPTREQAYVAWNTHGHPLLGEGGVFQVDLKPKEG